MVTDNHYRWDFIGLSTDEKPTPATSEKVVDGSTFYCSDTSKLYVYCQDQWYEKTATGGGGGGTTYTAGEGIDITNDTISVDTQTIQPKLTAGTNITIDENNEISATDTTYSNFTGTDGTSAGTAGLVPAPTTTDAGKFLKADGSWAEAGGGGGGIVTLTRDDVATYPGPAGTSNALGLWRLPSGIYKLASNVTGYARNNSSDYITGDYAGEDSIVIVAYSTATEYSILCSQGYTGGTKDGWYYSNNAARFSRFTYTGVSGTDTNKAMHQKGVTDFVNSKVINGGTTAPTTSTVGSVGTLYSCVESGTAHLYSCTSTSGGYTWSQLV